MSVKVKVPELGESVVEATVGSWHKNEGDQVSIGDVLVELETDKVNVEVGADTAGLLIEIRRNAGDDVAIGDVLAIIDPDAQAEHENGSDQVSQQAAEDESDVEAERHQADADTKSTGKRKSLPAQGEREETSATPVAQRMAEEKDVDLAEVTGTGPRGRITRQDVASFLDQQQAKVEEKKDRPDAKQHEKGAQKSDAPAARPEKRLRMSRRRRTIAQRLVEAQRSAAMLTTFNDVDMSAVIDLRRRRGEGFKERTDVKLGYMSFFVRATIGALKAYPQLNAEIDDDEVVLKQYYDIGIAVGVEDGLLVPVIRDADRKSFADIEHEVKALAEKAREGTISLEELRGGTFTITNGGIYGSLLSTPILNPPQVGILGMHRIEERPVAVDGEMVIRPMMYLALSYDHRIVDGREAVQFLVKVKELVEEPELLLLEG